MFKRANKITALLVAAASVMSIVPAMAATRIGTKDGHITGGAVAYADGKYVYDGYRTDEDDNGIYYNNGSDEKEKFNDDLRDYDLASKYGTKYVYGTDNNDKDQYLIDLTNGKIVDDETPEDKADSIKSALKSKLKKTDRYSNTGAWDTVDLGDSGENERYDERTRLFGSKFGEVWYAYTAKGDKAGTATEIGQTSTTTSFKIKLPTNDGTTQFTAGGLVVNRGVLTLNDFKDEILRQVKADPVVKTAFDVNTIVMNSAKTEITGEAKVAGAIDKTSQTYTELTAFASRYGTSLGVATVDTYAATASSLNLGVLKSAISSNQGIVTSTTTGSSVIISETGTGNATVTVKDQDDKTATIYVTVNSDGLNVVKTDKYFTATERQNALIKISSAELATYTDFEKARVTDLVTDDASSTTKLTVAEANEAIAKYTGVAKLAGTASEANVRIVLQDALDAKLDNIVSTQIVSVTLGQGAKEASIGDPDRYVGFVNESGKYIDVSATANIYVYSKAQQKTVKIKEYNKENADYDITVGLHSIEPLTQDKDYIYALATVNVLEGTGQVETQYFIQKISKEQGDTKDGAKLPKSVDSYQVDNKTIFDNGDSQVAYNFLVNHLEDGFALDNVSVKDGALYITGVKADGDNDKVKVFKIALKKGKIDTVSTYGQGKKEDVDVYIAKKDADTDIDIKADTRDTAVSYDVDGNTWVVSKGTITKITGTDKKAMYTCDRTFDHIDVYDENNLIVWDKDSDVYSNVAEGTKVTQSEATAVAPVIVTGWVQGTDGTWTFNDATGAKVVAKWINVGGVWYYMKADSIMATGWLNDNGTWYYLNGSGAMQTGWLNDNGTWYYLNGSGAMLANTTVDGYVLGASGAWIK